MTAKRIITDHGEFDGLADDDHVQYLLVNGTRAMTGALQMGNNDINDIDNLLFSGVDGEIAGIQNQNLLDKTVDESVTGDWDFSGADEVRLPDLVDLPAGTVFDVDADPGGFTTTMRFNGRGSIFAAYYFASKNNTYPFSFSLSNSLAGFQTGLGVPMAFVSADFVRFSSAVGAPVQIQSGDSNDYIEFTTTSNVPKMSTVGSCNLEIDAPGANIKILTSPFMLETIKSGATQGAAGAAANELWKTNGHATLPDNVVLIGV